MANVLIEQLTPAEDIGLSDLFVVGQSNEAKSITGQLLVTKLAEELDAHGGITSISKTGTQGNVDEYTITFSDANTSTFYVTNGTNGVGVSNVTFNDDTGAFTMLMTNGLYYNSPSLKGPPGSVPTITIGTVTKLAGDANPTVTISGTDEEIQLNFGIPAYTFSEPTSGNIVIS